MGTLSLSDCLKGECSQVGADLFSPVTSDRTRKRLCQGRSRLAIRKHFFMERVTKHGSSLPKKWLSYHPQRYLRNTQMGHLRTGLSGGLG